MQTRGEEPCLECPERKLDAYLATVRGRQLALVVDIDRFKEIAGIKYGPEDVTYLDVLLLGILGEEREKYQQELIEQAGKGKDSHGR